jgi:hypothetical protein
MKIKVSFLILLLSAIIGNNLFAQEIPLVFDVENTGADCPAPVLPSFDDLPEVKPLTDPFEWSDGSGRDTTFESWSCRRAEIKAELEHYEIGVKPDRPDSITASYADGILTVNVTVNDSTLTLTSMVTLPEGEGPFPAVIGMGGGSGSLPPDMFSSRNIATIGFNFGQVMQHTQSRGNEPYNRLYPDLTYVGSYSAWPWGVSRIIDGLELVADDLPIDLQRLAVTGCSFAGKMALFAGALDERIALTIAQESGGGGAAAWRVSQTLTGVENLGATSSAWFIKDMFSFAGDNVVKLPHDHHELMALVAPRALLVFGNPDYVWLADESGYVSCRAAERVWENFGIPERFGFVIEGGHMHCAASANQLAAAEAFVDRFLLGIDTINTDIEISTYPTVDYGRWTYWWGKGEPAFPSRDWQGTESVWLEAECASVGNNWEVIEYPIGSNGSVVDVKNDQENPTAEAIDSDGSIFFPFTLTTDTTFHFFIRLSCTRDKGSALWVKLDDGPFQKFTGLKTVGLQWKKVFIKDLTAGDHSITIAYTEAGAKIDKLCISSLESLPAEKGETAVNQCEPPFSSSSNLLKNNEGYSLGQNFPNPVNGKTNIMFEIPEKAYVSLKVYNINGSEVAELAGKEFPQGKHTVVFNTEHLTHGIYFYTLEAGNFSASQKMIIETR